MKLYPKNLILLLLVIGALLLIAATAHHYIHQVNQLSKTTSTNQSVPASEIITSNAPSDWKTYANTAYGYTIKYPGNWYVNTEFSDNPFTARGPAPYTYMGGDTSISNYSDALLQEYEQKNGPLSQPKDYFEITLVFIQVPASSSLRDYLNSVENVPTGNIGSTTEQDIILNGIPGAKLTQLGITGIGDNTKPNSTGIVLMRSGEIAEIGYGFDDSVQTLTPLADQIVNSFSFNR